MTVTVIVENVRCQICNAFLTKYPEWAEWTCLKNEIMQMVTGLFRDNKLSVYV